MLTAEQMERIRAVAKTRSVRAGEVLYEASQADISLFIVRDGVVSISRTGEDSKILAVREAGQFTGEMSILSGQRAHLKARVTAGLDLTGLGEGNPWNLKRPPMFLESSVPAIFAVGDARSGSMKRVASAVGEGSMAVHLIHRYLAEHAAEPAPMAANV
jgi:CRP-like cAMP-binding protein